MNRRWTTLIALPLALFASACGYNRIQSMDEQVNQAQGQIETQLQRRADLIPNLVATVKGITKQEDTVFISIANARARLGGAVEAGNVPEMAKKHETLTDQAGAPTGRRDIGAQIDGVDLVPDPRGDLLCFLHRQIADEAQDIRQLVRIPSLSSGSRALELRLHLRDHLRWWRPHDEIHREPARSSFNRLYPRAMADVGVVGGEPLVLEGKSVAAWRERIGNAVPVGTAKAIVVRAGPGS